MSNIQENSDDLVNSNKLADVIKEKLQEIEEIYEEEKETEADKQMDEDLNKKIINKWL